MIWDVSFGLNKGSPAVFKKFKIAGLNATIFLNRGALDVKAYFKVSWRSVISYRGPQQHAVKVYIIY
jgi:hypothetical protein